jgi:hypothetical protein
VLNDYARRMTNISGNTQVCDQFLCKTEVLRANLKVESTTKDRKVGCDLPLVAYVHMLTIRCQTHSGNLLTGVLPSLKIKLFVLVLPLTEHHAMKAYWGVEV